jgi:hypothetical protein
MYGSLLCRALKTLDGTKSTMNAGVCSDGSPPPVESLAQRMQYSVGSLCCPCWCSQALGHGDQSFHMSSPLWWRTCFQQLGHMPSLRLWAHEPLFFRQRSQSPSTLALLFDLAAPSRGGPVALRDTLRGQLLIRLAP